jgi:hypothetical protein
VLSNSGSLLSANAIKHALDAMLSPRFAALGVLWRGDYKWVEPGGIPVRRVISFLQLKGSAAVISWGLSLNFVPELSPSGIAYHRTARSARPDVFDWPASYRNSFSNPGWFAHIDCRDAIFEQSLNSYSSGIAPELTDWFERVRSVESIEEELERQVRRPELAYRLHCPSPMFVLAFVKARRGDLESAESLLLRACAATGDQHRLDDLRKCLRNA